MPLKQICVCLCFLEELWRASSLYMYLFQFKILFSNNFALLNKVYSFVNLKKKITIAENPSELYILFVLKKYSIQM